MTGRVAADGQSVMTSHPHNETYVHAEAGKKWIFIPCYPRIVVKSLRGLDVAKGKVTVEYTLIMSFACQGLPTELMEIVKSGIEYRINEQSHKLTHGENGCIVNYDEKTGLVNYTSRNSADVRFYVELLTTPFDSFDIKVKFELTSRPLKIDQAVQDSWKGKEFESFMGIEEYRFNFHENQKNKEDNLRFTSEAAQLYEYTLGNVNSKAELVCERKDNPKLKGIPLYQYVPVVIWHINLVRQPFNMVMTIFAPIIFLNLLLAAVFFQQTDLGDQLANLAAILLALLAYMPVFRQSIPPITKVSLGDQILLASLVNCLILYINILHRFALTDSSYNVTDNDNDRMLRWIYFFAYLFVLVVMIFYIAIRWCIHSRKTRKVESQGQTSRNIKYEDWKTLPLEHTLQRDTLVTLKNKEQVTPLKPKSPQ